MGAQQRLVGREAEQQRLLAALEGAANGAPSATLVHGEPGIGKTSLVRDLIEHARAEGVHTLFGQCLRFGADVTSYLPFIQAISQWLQSAALEDRDRVFPGVTTVAETVPALGNRDPESGIVLFQLSAALERLANDRPTLVVIDDLQWADPSSLDVLAYVIAGFMPGHRISVVGTYRDTELFEAHRLHGWLADMVRMPSVERLSLGRLDPWQTEQLVLQLEGTSTQAVFAEEVHARSGGNPYLAELLIAEARRGTPSTGSTGGGLSDALLAAWHRLTPPARSVTQLLAVGGRPVAFPVLRTLAVRRGMSREQLTEAVTEATGHGITVEHNSDVWFRHPLLAEVIADTLHHWEQVEVHKGYTDVWESASDVSERDRANHLALHYADAQDPDDAFTWSLRAADEAARVHAIGEEATHLSRAVTLAPSLSASLASGMEVIGLLTRAARTCHAAGEYRLALGHYEQALAGIDRNSRPLDACRLLLPLPYLRELIGLGSAWLFIVEHQEALALTDGLPPCEERALALAHLAFGEVFNGLEAASGHAEEAVRLAEQLNATAALTWALAVRAQTRWGTLEGIADAERAVDLARTQADTELLAYATVCLSNSYQSAGRFAAAAEITGEIYQVIRDKGSYHDAASVGAIAAEFDLTLGRWAQVRTVVREILAFRQAHRWGGTARCVAAILTVLEGDATAAGMHLRRAKELIPNPAPVGDGLVLAEMQHSIAASTPSRTLELAEATMAETTRVDPPSGDEYLLWAARAAADLAERADGTGQSRRDAIAWLERIEVLRGHEPPRFRPAGPVDTIHPALGALYAAERARCHGDRAAMVALWQNAAEVTGRAEMRYEHARALYFLARALLEERQGRRRASDALSRAHAIARELGAAPLLELTEQLAAQAHLHVVDAALGGAETQPDGPTLAGARLTRREGEVLARLVAGETYAQIAARLFISEKTVSVHVSNMLRKTGTISRIDLSALARRSVGSEWDSADT